MRPIPNDEARSEWARRHDLDPFMVLADLDVAPAPTKAEPNRVRVTFWRLTRDEQGYINGREEDTLYTSDAPPPQWLIPPRELRTLQVLARAGITGTDAITCLDTFIHRVSEYFAVLVADRSTEERHAWLTEVFESDAVRAAAVLIAHTEGDPS